MYNLIRIKKGLDLNLIGNATGEISDLTDKSTEFAINPDDYCGFIPKLLKKEGEKVRSGEALLYDKSHNEVKITSPITGTVKKIVRGERRKIERVVIEPDKSGEAVKFDISDLTPTGIQTTLMNAGIWVMMHQRPYDIMPEPGKEPRDIFVTTFDSSPLAPGYTLYINGNEDLFKKGIEILSKLTSGSVFIGCQPDNIIETPFSTTQIFKGPHPAGNVGIQIANTRPVNKGEVVWALNAETVVRIGYLFTYGNMDYSCIIALTGEMMTEPYFAKTKIGASVASLLSNRLKAANEECRIICGNALTGVKESIDGYIHYPFRQITVIPENANKNEFMGWASLSTKKYSASRTFFSWLFGKNKKYHFDAKINGGERAIIMAGEYDKVFPMDIYSEFLIKAILAKDIDKMEQLGIYEIAPEDFALCEFIDTSKLELQRIVREGLDYLRKEMN